MKNKIIARTFLLLPAIFRGTLVIAQLSAPADSRDKVLKEIEEPHHKVVLENEYVRLIEGHVPVKDTTLMHIHEANSVVVFLSKTSFGIQVPGGKPVITDVSPGDMFYRAYGDKPVTHIVWDQGASLFHFFVAEVVKQQPGKDTCSIISQSGVQFQWREKLVRAYYVDIAKGTQFNLPKSACAHLLINISGDITTSSSGSMQPISPNGFLFFPPQKNIRIDGGKENSRCILLELI
jgi:hypothetical protein